MPHHVLLKSNKSNQLYCYYLSLVRELSPFTCIQFIHVQLLSNEFEEHLFAVALICSQTNDLFHWCLKSCILGETVHDLMYFSSTFPVGLWFCCWLLSSSGVRFFGLGLCFVGWFLLSFIALSNNRAKEDKAGYFTLTVFCVSSSWCIGLVCCLFCGIFWSVFSQIQNFDADFRHNPEYCGFK